MKLRDGPKDTIRGPFAVSPKGFYGSATGSGRDAVIKYHVGMQSMTVERADVPDMIEALRAAYEIED